MSTGTITNQTTDANGVAVPSLTITIALKPGPGFRITDHTEISTVVTTTSNASGYWSIALEQTANIDPSGSYYTAYEPIPDSRGGPKTHAFTVASGTNTLRASLVSPPPSGPTVSYLTTTQGDARYVPIGTVGQTNQANQWTADQYFTSGRPSYDVVGDPTGATDSYAAIAAAIAAAAGNSAGGGVVRLGFGTYLTTASINVPTGVTLRGQGRFGTTIKAHSTFPTSTAVINLGGGSSSIAFWSRVEDLHIHGNDIAGSIGIYSERINEQSGAFRVLVDHVVSKGIYVTTPGSGSGPQNFSFDEIEVGLSTTSGSGAVGIQFRFTSTVSFRSLRRFTVNSSDGSTTLTGTAVMIDGCWGEAADGHVEHMPIGVLLGSLFTASGTRVSNVTGGPAMTTVVQVSNATTQQNYCLSGISNGPGATNSIVDQIKGITDTGFCERHEVGTGTVGHERIISTEIDIYPWTIDVDPTMSPVASTNWNNPTVNANLIRNGAQVSTGAQNASITFDVVTGAGTYAVEMMHWRDTNIGIYTMTIDGSSTGLSTVDGYNASSSYNTRSAFGTLLLAAGKHRIVITMATKNASSSSYFGAIQHLRLTRSS